MEGLIMNSFTKLIKQSILSATLLGLTTPIFAGQSSQSTTSTSSPSLLTPSSATLPTLTSASTATGPSTSAVLTPEQEQKRTVSTEKEDKIVVADKRSGLTPLQFAGVLAGTGLALYGAGKLTGYKLSWPEQITGIAVTGLAIVGNVLNNHEKTVEETTPLIKTSSGTVLDKDSKEAIDRLQNTNKELNKITQQIGYNPSRLVCSVITDEVSGAGSTTEKGQKIPFIGFTQRDFDRLVSDNAQQKNMGKYIAAHEMIHLREKHSEKKKLLQHSVPFMYLAALPLGLGILDTCARHIPLPGKGLAPLLKWSCFLLPIIQSTIKYGTTDQKRWAQLSLPSISCKIDLENEGALAQLLKIPCAMKAMFSSELYVNAYSRTYEQEADIEGALATGIAQDGVDFHSEIHNKRESYHPYSRDTLPWWVYVWIATHPSDTARIAYLEPIAKLQAQDKSEQEIRETLWPIETFWKKHKIKIIAGTAAVGATAAGAVKLYNYLKQ
jgi:hypothetical protein